MGLPGNGRTCATFLMMLISLSSANSSEDHEKLLYYKLTNSVLTRYDVFGSDGNEDKLFDYLSYDEINKSKLVDKDRILTFISFYDVTRSQNNKYSRLYSYKSPEIEKTQTMYKDIYISHARLCVLSWYKDDNLNVDYAAKQLDSVVTRIRRNGKSILLQGFFPDDLLILKSQDSIKTIKEFMKKYKSIKFKIYASGAVKLDDKNIYNGEWCTAFVRESEYSIDRVAEMAFPKSAKYFQYNSHKMIGRTLRIDLKGKRSKDGIYPAFILPDGVAEEFYHDLDKLFLQFENVHRVEFTFYNHPTAFYSQSASDKYVPIKKD